MSSPPLARPIKSAIVLGCSALKIIMKRAKKCLNFDYEEASWNMEVLHRLLHGMFRQPKSAVPEPFDFMLWYVRLGKRWLIYAFLMTPVSMSERFARSTITQTVNHTEYSALQLSPIVLSIETKRPGKDLDVAQKFLRSAVEVVARSRQPEGASEEAIADAVEGLLTELGFLPGVIIQGHHWYFDGTNVTAHRTILWTEQEFGSTQSMLKMYQIVAGLRRLSKWAQDVYVPWYRKHVLGGRTLN
ncbi:hypothetical protein LCI18_005935 [Fusarium solani-melongenae]|uniref:Uncharacterized protein n=1 Tax=Fusarium solani subsp. cucurbitae TaxID=2747967 RepID=A0ACD3Z1C1_FUSSC|nr:hypothetical protein LCI18_005935 [Fusarium solani-melongenae]